MIQTLTNNAEIKREIKMKTNKDKIESINEQIILAKKIMIKNNLEKDWEAVVTSFKLNKKSKELFGFSFCKINTYQLHETIKDSYFYAAERKVEAIVKNI